MDDTFDNLFDMLVKRAAEDPRYANLSDFLEECRAVAEHPNEILQEMTFVETKGPHTYLPKHRLKTRIEIEEERAK
jgi:hypothetical protein